MCTVTVLPLGGRWVDGFRLACNRDESWGRSAATPPKPGPFGDCVAVMPVDPASGGTWVAANDAGLAMALLNRVDQATTSRASAERLLSRGLIIPSLLECATPREALDRASGLIDPRRFAPFRLVIAGSAEIIEIHSDDSRLRSRCDSLGRGPRLFTSSGLGDHLVEGSRLRLLTAFFAMPGDRSSLQDAFHRHSWPERPHLSVCMRRPEAGTVSCTIIEVTARLLVMRYLPGAPDEDPVPVTISLARRAPPVVEACAG